VKKIVISSSGRDKFDINIDNSGWKTDLTLDKVVSYLQERNFSESTIKQTVSDLCADGTAIVKESVNVSDKMQNIRYQKTVTIVDPTTMGDTIKPITVLLIAEIEEIDEEIDEDNIVIVYWTDSDVKVLEKRFDTLEEALTVYNDIVTELEDIHKLLSVDLYDEALAASSDFLRELELLDEEA